MNLYGHRLIRRWLLGVALLFIPWLSLAEPMKIPVFVKYSMMQQIMLKEMFKGPGQTAVYRLADNNCATASFSHPQLSGGSGLMQVRANVVAQLGMPADTNKCGVGKQWSGRVVVHGQPVIIGTESLAVQFKVVKAEIFDAAGNPVNSGLVQAALEGHLHPLLDQFKVDLKPNLQQLTSVLPFMLPNYSSAQIQQLINSVRIGTIDVRNEGLKIAVNLSVDKQAILNLVPGLF